MGQPNCAKYTIKKNKGRAPSDHVFSISTLTFNKRRKNEKWPGKMNSIHALPWSACSRIDCWKCWYYDQRGSVLTWVGARFRIGWLPVPKDWNRESKRSTTWKRPICVKNNQILVIKCENCALSLRNISWSCSCVLICSCRKLRFGPWCYFLSIKRLQNRRRTYSIRGPISE